VVKRTLFFAVFVSLIDCAFAQTRVDSLIAILNDVETDEILVVAHRGDWRNAPENSLQAFKNCIDNGVHMIELDLKKSKDGHLIIMHDKTIDRTTNGKGNPENYTLAELKEFRLKNGLGRVTTHPIPTLEEVLQLCKGKILINIDKGYDYFNDVYQLLQKTGTTKQVVIKSGHPLSKVEAENKEILSKVLYMPIVAIDNSDADKIIEDYLTIKPAAFECTFNTLSPDVLRRLQYLQKKKAKIWLNSLWPSLSAGHDDDKAVEEGKEDETWGWLIDNGARIIQTDRPYELLRYVASNK
jgi:glycerophosphoryl diester phosphodiesterase